MYSLTSSTLFQFYDSPIKRKRLTVAEIAEKLFQFYDSPIKSV